MSAESPIVICSAPDLRAYLLAWPWRWIGARDAIALRLPLLDEPLQSRTEERLNFLRTVCGCQVGALLLITTLASRIPMMLHSPEWTWKSLAIEGSIALLVALVGKLLAITGGRLLLAIG